MNGLYGQLLASDFGHKWSCEDGLSGGTCGYRWSCKDWLLASVCGYR